jgi:hypothetical protein
VLTGGGDGRESPDFEGAAAVRHGGRLGLVRRQHSDARLATGSGVEGMAHRPGAYGGDGVLQRLPRPAGRRSGAWLLGWRRLSAEGGARQGGGGGMGFMGVEHRRPSRARLGRRGVAAAGCSRSPASPGLARGGGSARWACAGLERARAGRAGTGAGPKVTLCQGKEFRGRGRTSIFGLSSSHGSGR